MTKLAAASSPSRSARGYKDNTKEVLEVNGGSGLERFALSFEERKQTSTPATKYDIKKGRRTTKKYRKSLVKIRKGKNVV